MLGNILRKVVFIENRVQQVFSVKLIHVQVRNDVEHYIKSSIKSSASLLLQQEQYSYVQVQYYLCVLHIHAPDYVKLLSCLLTYMLQWFLSKITQIHSVFFPVLCFVSVSVVLDSLNRLALFSVAGSLSAACGDLFLAIHHDMPTVTYIVYTRLYSWT